MVGNGKSNKNRLRVRRVVDVPLREVSGICLRRGRNGRMFLIAVGDRVAKIAWFSTPRSEGGRIDWHTRNIAKLSGSRLPEHDSQIEAVCADGLGRVLLLQETPPRVELIDPKALKVVASTLPRHCNAALLEQRSLLDRAIQAQFKEPEQLSLARMPDPQGLGGHSGYERCSL